MTLGPQLKRSVALFNLPVALLMFLAIAFSISSQIAFAQEKPPVVSAVKKIKVPVQKHILPGSIGIQITPRGMKYFENNLSDLLGNLGIGLDEFYTPTIEWISDKSYNIEDLNVPEETKAVLQTTKNMLTQWFVGFSLKQLKPAVRLGESGYVAHFKRMALTAEPELMKQLNKTSGAVLALEMEIQDLNIATSKIRVQDQNNQWLGEVGLDSTSLKIGGETPIRVRMPFFIDLSPQGELIFEALKIEQNFTDVDLEFKYKKLIAPSIKIIVNDKVMELNKAQLEKEFNKNSPILLKESRKLLSQFATQQLPEFLNEKARQFLKGELEEAKEMDLIGAPKGHTDPNFVWGLILDKIYLNKNLQINLDAYIEDEKNVNSSPSKARINPALVNEMNPLDYDIAMNVDQSLFNRILQLNFERGYFSKIEIDSKNPSKTIKLLKQPTVIIPTAAEKGPADPVGTYIKINTKIKTPPGTVSGFFPSLAVNDEPEIEFDAIIKLEKAQPSGVKMVFWSVPQDSIKFDEKYLTGFGRLFRGTVIGKVKSFVAELEKDLRQKKSELPGILPLPPELAGIRLDIAKMSAENGGQIVLYLKYAEHKQFIDKIKDPSGASNAK
jgi:hypothetical protein